MTKSIVSGIAGVVCMTSSADWVLTSFNIKDNPIYRTKEVSSDLLKLLE